MPADAIAVLVVFGGDADGRTFVSADALLDLARVANRPVFVNGSWLLGTGAVGGDVLDVARLGQLTGSAVLRVLDDQATAPPVRPAGGVTRWMFDAAQLRRWNISESTLPAGSVVLNREVPAWRRYLWTVVAAVALVTVQGGIISGLLVQRRNRRRIDAALRSSEAKARASYDEARDLAGRLISARESERTRIARDLHGQSVPCGPGVQVWRDRAQRSRPLLRRQLVPLRRGRVRPYAHLRHRRRPLRHEDVPRAKPSRRVGDFASLRQEMSRARAGLSANRKDIWQPKNRTS